MDELIQYIVVRKDLNMSHGKMAAQVAHASLLAYRSTYEPVRKPWFNGSMAKVVLGVKDRNEFDKLQKKLQNNDIDYHVVIDECRTELEKEGPAGTATCLAIGPIPKSKVYPVIKRVRLY